MRSPRRAFSLIEAVISIVLVSGLLVASLSALGASARTQADAADRGRALLLAQDLMSEILLLPYVDPEEPASAIGLNAGEVGSDRSTFDDVDDYHAWSSEPPVDSAGNPIAGAEGLRRHVRVRYLDPDDLDSTDDSETGVKRIRVRVLRGERLIVKIHAVCTRDGQASWTGAAP